MCTRFFHPLLLSVALICSCSVKSDRSACPGLLFMSVSGGDDAGVSISVRSTGSESGEKVHIEKIGGIARAGFDLNYGKNYEVCCFNGVDQNWSGEIEFGCQMPSLFAYVCEVECVSEVNELSALLAKQFCRVNIEVKGVDCAVRLRSNVCGVELSTLAPIQGHFCALAQPVMNSQAPRSHFIVNVPRQIDLSLSLDLLDAQSQEVFYTRNIGSILEAGGMDWSKDSLPDVYLTVEYVDNSFNVSVQNWEKIEL